MTAFTELSPSPLSATSFTRPGKTRSITTTSAITTLGIDADDTLWHNEDGFHRVEQRFVEIVTPFLAPDTTHDILGTLAERERSNVRVFGYGVKSFTFSMIEAAVSLSGGTINALQLTNLIDEGRSLLTRPTEVFDGMHDTLALLADRFDLVLITKGDSHHQNAKVKESGVERWFSSIRVVEEKDPHTYERIVSEQGISPAAFAMVGNSVKSDVLPVLAMGGTAVHIPYALTWALEVATVDEHHLESGRFHALERLAELPALLNRINTPTG